MRRIIVRDSDSFVFLSLALSAGAFGVAVWEGLKLAAWHFETGAFKDITAGISSLATASAVFVGGGWAYFKFLRGRTYQPRLDVSLAAEWLMLGDRDVFHVRITVRNIGASMIALNQNGSGLEVAFPASTQSHKEITWIRFDDENVSDPAKQAAGVFPVLQEHAWIEPGETVSDDLLLNLGVPKTMCLLESTLKCALSDKEHGDYSDNDVEVFTRRILPPVEKMQSDAKIADTLA